MHQHFAVLLILSLLTTAPCGLAQQGDRKGHIMKDPIPADKIPPSPYLGLKDALASFKLANGYVIEPVAYGENVNLAVAISFDANGRAWTCEMRGYMPDISGKGESKPNGRIRVLEDTDGDGVYEKATTFLDGLVLPRAVAVTSDGCLYSNGQALYFINRKGLKPTGKPVVVDPTYARGGNPEHQANGLLYGHDNWYYNAKSSKRYRRIASQWISEKTNHRGQWGISKDNAGRLYHNTNSTILSGDQFRPNFFRGNPHYTPKANMAFKLGSNRTHPVHMTPGINRGYMKGALDREGKLVNATAACGPVIYRGDNFPPSAREIAFVCEPSGDLVKAVKVTRDSSNKPSGSHPLGDKEFLASSDEWFLPCNLYTGPDGTLWLVDMYFGLLQHKTYMTTYLRKQYLMRGLDKPKPSTGRIYRIRYQKKNPSPVPQMEGLPATRLVKFLSHPNGLHRDTAQRLIVESGDTRAVGSLEKLAADKLSPWGQIHALWTLDGLDHVSAKALSAALGSPRPEVVNTALDIIAIRRITQPAVVDAVTRLATAPRTIHCQVRALAATGHAPQALKLTLKNNTVPLLREAFISGLGNSSATFHQQTGQVKDSRLQKLLTAASHSGGTRSTTPGAHLSGDGLASFQRGRKIFTDKAACLGCHGADGNGLPNLGPPLAKSEWVTGDPSRLTKILLHGLTGPVKVNGTVYKPALAMPGLAANTSISSRDIADVINYIRNNWGNRNKLVQPAMVDDVRKKTKHQTTPYTTETLSK